MLAFFLPLHGFIFFAQSGFRSGVFFLYFLARCHSVMAAFNLWYFNLIARRT